MSDSLTAYREQLYRKVELGEITDSDYHAYMAGAHNSYRGFCWGSPKEVARDLKVQHRFPRINDFAFMLSKAFWSAYLRAVHFAQFGMQR